MKISLQEIGGFQFENLIRNRIPFVLLSIKADISNLFPAYHQSHLDRQTHQTDSTNALKTVQEISAPAEQAIVLVSPDGHQCEKVANQLEAAGYTNVFWVRGGVAALRQELE